MRCSELCALLEQEYALEYACEWDNVGLLAGRKEKDIKKILLALDATDEVVQLAVDSKVDMLITHHPMLFSAIKRVTNEDMIGRRLVKLIQNDISYYAMHTNYDSRGMADFAAEKLGLTECTVLEEIKDGEGIGRVGVLPRKMSLLECAELVKSAYSLPNVRIFGAEDAMVYLAALCPGSGKSTLKRALDFACDVYITGDIDHHTGIDAVDQGLMIIDAGHYGIEHIFMEDIKAFLEKKTTGLHIDCVGIKQPFKVI